MTESLPAIRREDRDDGVAVLTFDRPGSSANIFDNAALALLDSLVDEIAADPGVKGLVLVSAKPKIFIAGADLESIANAKGDVLRSLIEKGQRVFQKTADLKIPTVAAIHGACLGGGLEVALACDWRVASPDKATKIGLPETMLGILPAWGGSTRLSRLIGLPKALGLILSGKQLAPKYAKKLGGIDDLAPKERLLDRALQLLAQGKPKRKSHLLTNNPISAKVIAAKAKKDLLAKTRGNYPAQLAALDVVVQGASGSVEDSLARERDEVLRLAESNAARNLIRVFHLQENAKRFRRAPSVNPKSVERTAVIGAGVMGSGIAQWLSARKLPVILQDIDPERVAAGMASITKLYDGAVKRRIFSAHDAKLLADRVQPAAEPVPLHQADLVIEAAVERLDIKKQIFADLCARSRPDTILATNTSALPISELGKADGVTHPERILGLHFFNPVARMKLVEIVVTDQTSDEAIETALQFTRRIGKLPVVVKDSPGFLVNRILMPYLIEAGRLFERGVDAREIDEAMLDFGMPMGPIRLLDEIGLDVALHVAETMSGAFGERFALPDLLNRLVEDGQLGRKAGAGFYVYGDLKAPEINPKALALRSGSEAPTSDREALAERLALLMVNEGFRVLEEGVAAKADDVDFAMILGTGFAPFRGGPMHWANSLGVSEVRKKLTKLSETEGEFFEPAHLLTSAADLKSLGMKPK